MTVAALTLTGTTMLVLHPAAGRAPLCRAEDSGGR
jgi:hypothetical protein